MKPSSGSSSLPTGGGVVIDIGTGDGLFVSQSAKANPDRIYIGIDPSTRPLEKISEKIHRKPAKGGLPNALFLQAAVEDLPRELDGVADEVHVHFPWGSLLRAVASGDERVLRNLRRLCAPEALLEVVIGFHAERDRGEFDRLGVQPLSLDFIDAELNARYRAAGFAITERGTLVQPEWAHLPTTWARRLSSGADRTVLYVIAAAAPALAVNR